MLFLAVSPRFLSLRQRKGSIDLRTAIRPLIAGWFQM